MRQKRSSTFSSSERQVRILGPVIQPAVGALLITIADGCHRRAI